MAKKSCLFRHLIEMEALSKEQILTIFDKATSFLKQPLSEKSVLNNLEGKIVVNFFAEPSTRTKNSFLIAEKRLSAIVLDLDIATSSSVKGESLIDTVHSLESMGTDIFVVRHSQNNTPQFIASELTSHASVINAGDGTHQHPTQTLIDLFTIYQQKKSFENLKVAIIGDIAHSRVARSLMIGLNIMGVHQIHLIGPTPFIPEDVDQYKAKPFRHFEEGLKDVDVIVALRIQHERMEQPEIPDSNKYFNDFGLTSDRLKLAKKEAIIMHPGPVNRGVEIESAVIDGPQSLILEQVKNGVAIRMAVMDCMI